MSTAHPDPAPTGPPEPATGLVRALTDLLRGTHLAPPERLPDVVHGAARRMGLPVRIYLVDHAMETLFPLPGHGDEPLDLEGTLAGRAFRHLESQVSTAEDEPVLWMPIIDGVVRLGVLRITVPDVRTAHDPAFLRECWAFTHYLGHLVEVLDRYGDGLDAVRRSRPRNSAAELVWHLLPPPTAGTDKVIVSGRLEPANRVGGDVFDYALGEHTADLAIFDATGHDLGAGLIASAALAAYRNARREGRGLFEQEQAVHRTVVEHFGDQDLPAYATGVLAQLDLASGHLRYIAAGHPSPLVMRDGRVVKSLNGGRRPLFGLTAGEPTLGEEQLEPGDILVLYTDGIPEARDEEGREFGLARMTDFLEREYADGAPLPEVVRRLCKTILAYQHGVLQDDATVVLVHWTTEGQQNLEPAPLY